MRTEQVALWLTVFGTLPRSGAAVAVYPRIYARRKRTITRSSSRP